MKLCFACGKTKPLSDFYKHSEMADGHLGKCKECVKAYQKTRTGYERERGRKPDRKAKAAVYAGTPGGKFALLKGRKRYVARNPNKRAAHVILGNAVRDGLVIKPSVCSACGSGGRIHGHHHDYSKPLDVEWLCASCHRDRHASD